MKSNHDVEIQIYAGEIDALSDELIEAEFLIPGVILHGIARNLLALVSVPKKAKGIRNCIHEIAAFSIEMRKRGDVRTQEKLDKLNHGLACIAERMDAK